MVTGVGYGFTACVYAPEQYNDIEVISAGTELNRSFDNNLEVLKIPLFYWFLCCSNYKYSTDLEQACQQEG